MGSAVVGLVKEPPDRVKLRVDTYPSPHHRSPGGGACGLWLGPRPGCATPHVKRNSGPPETSPLCRQPPPRPPQAEARVAGFEAQLRHPRTPQATMQFAMTISHSCPLRPRRVWLGSRPSCATPAS